MSINFKIRYAASVIRNSGIISYPTESVYGLGCDPLSQDAVERILTIKQRPVEKGLIIVASTLDQLKFYTTLSTENEKKISSHKSPMTWLVKKSAHTPSWISGKHNKIAIRISKHPLVQAICTQLNQPIVSTSANPAGLRPASNNLESRRYFGDEIDYYLSGDTGILGKPTPITDIETGALIRST